MVTFQRDTKVTATLRSQLDDCQGCHWERVIECLVALLTGNVYVLNDVIVILTQLITLFVNPTSMVIFCCTLS